MLKMVVADLPLQGLLHPTSPSIFVIEIKVGQVDKNFSVTDVAM